MPSSSLPRLLLYFVIINLALLTAVRSHCSNVGTPTTSSEYDYVLDGILLSLVTNTSDQCQNSLDEMVKRDPVDPDFKTLVLSPREGFIETWTGSVSIFDRASEQVLFSTGESDTWIREGAFDMHDELPPASSSFKEGGYEGEVYQAPLTVAGMKVETDIARVSKYPAEYETARVGSGVVGLGFGVGKFSDKPTFYQHAIKQKLVKEPVFGFDLGKAPNPEIHFGGLDSSRFVGEIEWHVLVPFQNAKSWIIGKGEIDIGNEKGVVQGMNTLIDTGAQGIYGPADAVKKIFEHIPGSVECWPRRYAVPCENLPKISLRWGAGKPWEFKHDSFIVRKLEESHKVYKMENVKKETPMCLPTLRVGPQRKEVEYDWIIGTSFLKNVYAAFDMGGHRMGFGEIKENS